MNIPFASEKVINKLLPVLMFTISPFMLLIVYVVKERSK